jgi:hypothetical protein
MVSAIQLLRLTLYKCYIPNSFTNVTYLTPHSCYMFRPSLNSRFVAILNSFMNLHICALSIIVFTLWFKSLILHFFVFFFYAGFRQEGYLHTYTYVFNAVSEKAFWFTEMNFIWRAPVRQTNVQHVQVMWWTIGTSDWRSVVKAEERTFKDWIRILD